jgi:hypothetical protein
MTPTEVWKNENIYQGNRTLGQNEAWKFNYLHSGVKYLHTFSVPEIFNLTLPAAFLPVTTMPTSTTIAATVFTVFYAPDFTVQMGFRF